MNLLLSPEVIERESYNIIRKYLQRELYRNEDEYEIAVRVAHSTADIELAKSLVIHKDFIAKAVQSILDGLPIFTDVEMARAGLQKYANSLNIDVISAINFPEVIEYAQKYGITKGTAAARKILKEKKIGMVVCGNSPTFLAEVLRVIENKEGTPPYAIIGIPVGFVSAEEIKKYLAEEFPKKSSTPFITNLSPKGGTPPAVSIAIFIINKAREIKGVRKSYGEHS